MITLESVVDITGGELLNTPSVARFSSIAFSLSEVSYRSLFVCENKNEVEEAIKRGAYGILGADLDVVDSEIAFIDSPLLSEAKIKLLRYFFIQEKIKLIKCDYLSILIFKALLTDARVCVMDDLDSFSVNKNPLYCICNESMADRFGLEFEHLKKDEHSLVYSFKGVFNLNIRAKNQIEITFCNAFCDEIVSAIEFFEKNDLAYSLPGLKKYFPLDAIFLDGRAILTTDNPVVYEKIEEYLKGVVLWGKVVCLKNPQNIDSLLNSGYLYMLLLIDDATPLKSLLTKQEEEKLLF